MIHPGNEFALLDPIDGETYLRVVGDISLQKDIAKLNTYIPFDGGVYD